MAPGAPLSVNYNPTEYTLDKGAQIAEIAIPGLDSPILGFVRGGTETFSRPFLRQHRLGHGRLGGLGDHAHRPILSTGKDRRPGSRARSVFSPGRDVPRTTQLRLDREPGAVWIQVPCRERPAAVHALQPAGLRLRATLTVSLKEYKTLSEQIAELNMLSADHTHSHVVQIGETLAQISASVYNDPTQWRAIAAANALTNPLDLIPGATLQIPPLIVS